ncbi:sigma 54-interacting transcriptional regulator [Acidobacteriota bacterium]
MITILSFKDLKSLQQLSWWEEVLEVQTVHVLMLHKATRAQSETVRANVKGTENLKIDWLTLDSRVNPELQASHILERLQCIIGSAGDAVLCAYIEAFPVGLYEELLKLLGRSDRLYDLPPLYPLLPAASWLGETEPFRHKNPDSAAGLEDIEFSPELLDDEEQRQLKLALLSRRSLLLTGDMGTGKTLLARYIHFHTSETAGGSFEECNFAAIPETLFEAILTGTVRGAYTDATPQEGLLEKANGGSLFIDELAETSQTVQAKLLRYVSERIDSVKYRKLGETQQRQSWVRFIAATNLAEQKWPERFRPDLRARFPIRVHLGRISEKRPDPFLYCLRAIRHFTKVDLAGNPLLIPRWDVTILKKLFPSGVLPDNYRDLHSFVTRVWDRRRSRREWDPVVEPREIEAALQERQSFKKTYDPPSEKSPPGQLSPLDVIAALKSHKDWNFTERIPGADQLSEDDAKELVYVAKRLALQIALFNSEGNQARARRIYGMPRPDAFEKLRLHPERLHPDAPKRR